MKIVVSLAVVAFCLVQALPCGAQEEIEKIRRDHEKQMREMEQRQKAEREKMDRDFRDRLERASKKDPAGEEVAKRCAELLQQIEKLAAEVRELQSRIHPSGKRRVIERVIEGFNDGQPFRIVPRDRDEELELEMIPRKFEQIVPKKK